MNFDFSKARSLWKQLTDRAAHCRHMTKDNTAGGAWWQRRADRYQHFADLVLALIELEIEYLPAPTPPMPVQAHAISPQYDDLGNVEAF